MLCEAVLIDVATTAPKNVRTANPRIIAVAMATTRGIRKYRVSRSISGARQYVNKRAKTKGTNTGRSRYSAIPRAISVSATRHHV